MALELRMWRGWNNDGTERVKRRKGEKKTTGWRGETAGSVSLLDKLFIIFIARKQKISRERGRRLDQSTEECKLVGKRAADLQLGAKRNH